MLKIRDVLQGVVLLSLFGGGLVAEAQGKPDATVELLEKLSNAPGPSGAEEAVRAIMVREMTPLATAAIRYDGTGAWWRSRGRAGRGS